jgi:hypothetical protein
MNEKIDFQSTSPDRHKPHPDFVAKRVSRTPDPEEILGCAQPAANGRVSQGVAASSQTLVNLCGPISAAPAGGPEVTFANR